MAKSTRTKSSGAGGKTAKSDERRRPLRFAFGARGREIAGVLLIATLLAGAYHARYASSFATAPPATT